MEEAGCRESGGGGGKFEKAFESRINNIYRFNFQQSIYYLNHGRTQVLEILEAWGKAQRENLHIEPEHGCRAYLMIKTTEDDLRKSFDSFGTIADVSLKQKDTGIVFAFIEYDSTQGAERAV